jgi:hypothetical protein
MPLPIPEIISTLNRINFKENHNGDPAECAICWVNFKDTEEVTPLICD